MSVVVDLNQYGFALTNSDESIIILHLLGTIWPIVFKFEVNYSLEFYNLSSMTIFQSMYFNSAQE